MTTPAAVMAWPTIVSVPTMPPDVMGAITEHVRRALVAESDDMLAAFLGTDPTRYDTLMLVETWRSLWDGERRWVACRWDWPEPERHPGWGRPCP